MTPSVNSSLGKLVQFYFPSLQDKDVIVPVVSIASTVPVFGLFAVGGVNDLTPKENDNLQRELNTDCHNNVR